MLSRPSLTSVDDRGPGQRHARCIAQPGQHGRVRAEENQAIAAIARLGAVVADIFQHRIEGLPFLLARVPVLGREHDEPQCAVVGHVAMRREDVDAVEESGAPKHAS